MKWRVRKEGTRERALHQWHLWFAWYPVDVPTKGKMQEKVLTRAVPKNKENLKKNFLLGLNFTK